MPIDIKNKNKGQIRKPHDQISLKVKKNLTENCFKNFIFLKIVPFLSFRRSKHNSHLARRCF